jgi:hypothetical protein
MPCSAASSIEMTLPAGVVGAPALPRFVKEEDGGWMVDQHPEASFESQQQLRAMLREQKAAFAYSAAELTGYAGEHPPFRLDLTSEEPIRTPRRLLAPLAKAVADEKCGELLDAGFIESVRGPSIPYVSAVTIAAKKDSQGEWTEKRFCIDYRAVNAKTPLDHYPMQLQPSTRSRTTCGAWGGRSCSRLGQPAASSGC